MKIMKIIVKDIKFIITCDSELKKEVFRSLRKDGILPTLSRIRETLKNNFNTSNQIAQQLEVKANYKKEKQPILVVVHEAQPAGAALLSLNIIKILIKTTNYQPVVLLLRGGELVSEFKRFAEVYELNLTSFYSLDNESIVDNIIAKVSSEGVRYALCNSVTCGLPLKYIKKYKIKTITMVHELPTSIFNYQFVKAAECVQKYTDYVVFPAEFVRDEFLKYFPMEMERIRIIPQGMYGKNCVHSYDEKKECRSRLHEQLKIPFDCKIIVGMGYGNFRKGLDLFVSTARYVCTKNRQYHFVWVGNVDSEFRAWMDYDINLNVLQDNFHWMDYEKNPSYIYAGSDVFFLSSREDPFPSVALEAMANYTPVVAYEQTGGIPEILKDNKGFVLPYGELKEFYSILEWISQNSNKVKEIVKRANQYVYRQTPESYVKKLLNTVMNQPLVKESYKVSVIIPNYNYENYLEERLESILKQTYEPYEIIFLDDCSTDCSVDKAKNILEKSGIRYQIVTNTVNNGCFRQWIKGIRLAEGDLVWIAEADDVCELSFLENVVDAFEDDEVNLSYAQSEVIDEFGNHSGFVYSEYTRDLDENKWNCNYVNFGQSEIIDGLGIKNTIPNASGVVMRKSALEGIEEELKEYSISGDWFTYVYLIKQGKIAFYANVLNYHRRHSSSIIHKREQDIQLFIELMNIKKFIAKQFMIPERIREQFLNHVPNEYERLSCVNHNNSFYEVRELVSKQTEIEGIVDTKIEQYSFLKNKNQKRILFIMPDMEMGGGQMLVVRLANFFSDYHQTYVYNARPAQVEERVVMMIGNKVNILASKGTPDDLKQYIDKEKINIINSHIWWSDKIAYQAIYDMYNVKDILSMHGCYEMLMHTPACDSDFKNIVSKVFERANHIIYATDKNREIFESIDTPVEKIHKIHYGYRLESIPKRYISELGGNDNSFVFGQVARGIKEKGFEESIQAFLALKKEVNKKISLVLVGNGPFIDGLKRKYKYNDIFFIDNIKKPSEWIGWVKTFDVGLLPTYFVSESLPNTVIEYLAYQVPVISTNIGDIKNMIIANQIEAGILLELENMKVNVVELKEAMKKMLLDKDAYKIYKEGTKQLFKQFDMCSFADSYYQLFVS